MVALTYLPEKSMVVGGALLWWGLSVSLLRTDEVPARCWCSAALAANERNMGKPATDPNRGIIGR